MLEAFSKVRTRGTRWFGLAIAVLLVTGCAHPWFHARRKPKAAHPPSPFVDRESDHDYVDPDESSLRGGKS